MSTNPNPILKMISTANDQIFAKIFAGTVTTAEINKLYEYVTTADKLNAPDVAAWIQLTIGIYHDLHGKQGLAISQYEEAFHRAASVNDHKHMAAARSSMGELYRYRGEYQTALAYYEEAIAIIQSAQGEPESSHTSLSNDAVFANVFACLGQTYLALKRLTEAEKAFETVIDGFKESSRSSIDAIILVRQGLAEVYLHQRKVKEAWSSVQLAEREAAALKDHFFLSIIYLTMAHIAQLDRAHHTSPEVYYQKSRIARSKLGQSALVGQLLMEEARYQRRFGNFDGAERFANEANTMFSMLSFDELVNIATSFSAKT